MRKRLGAAIVIAGLFGTNAYADEEIQWKQIVNIPKGANLAPDVAWDVLGISAGDSYKTVRPVLEALLAESIPQQKPKDKFTAQLMGQDLSEPLEEVKVSIYLPVPGGKDLKAPFVNRVELKRQLKSTGKPIDDNMTLTFSTPASGNQVLSIKRSIYYWEHSDQVRIGEMIKSISAKYGAAIRVTKTDKSTELRLAFDNGKVFTPKNSVEDCAAWMPMDINEIDQINRTGTCDVVLMVTLGHGISEDHASAITFQIADYARGKENLTADRRFLDSYVEDVRSRTAGQAPKL